MRITSTDDVARLVALRCAPGRVADVRSLIAESGILLRGHFQLQSGAHSEYFLRARGLTSRAEFLDAFAQELLLLIKGHNSHAVVCPESAGFALGEAVARLAGIPITIVKTDINRRPTSELRAGTITPGSSVLLVNDVATSGSSLLGLHRAVTTHGAVVQRALTLAAIGTRALKLTNDLRITGTWLMEGLWPLSSRDSCELCRQDVPLILSAELG